MASQAITTTKLIKSGLYNFQEVVVSQIQLPLGIWAIFGRVSIRNHDSDPQDGSAMLRIVPSPGGGYVPPFIDYVGVRIEGHFGQQVVTVQAIHNTKDSGDTIELVCTSYKGSALAQSFIAIKVDEFKTQ